MKIAIFNELTPEEKIQSIEAESEKYIGLYVDMKELEQRKYVKEKESEILAIRKALNASRIRKVKDYTATVKAEFDAIDARLAKANEPFSLLHDEHKAERANVLAKEKADREAVLMAEQKEIDHEFALLLDKTYLHDIQEKAKQAELAEIGANAERENNARIARESDKAHKAKVNNSILAEMLKTGVTDEQAKQLIRMIVNNAIDHLTINY